MPPSANEIDPLVQRLVGLDTHLGGLSSDLQTRPELALQGLRDSTNEAFKLTGDLVHDVRSLLRIDYRGA
jgi:hypothetical protein